MTIKLIQVLTELQMLILDWNCRKISSEKEFIADLSVLTDRLNETLDEIDDR